MAPVLPADARVSAEAASGAADARVSAEAVSGAADVGLRAEAASARHRLLFVHAHPDDESLATGGTIARYAAAPDTAVTLVTCTLGEQGEVIGSALAGLAAEHADQLGGYRIGELAAACAALGLRDHRFLGGAGRWRDSGMALAGHGLRAATPDVLHPRAFAAPAALEEQVDALVAVLEDVRPQVVVSYGADGGYGHPDHVRAHDITAAAVARVPSVRKRYAAVISRSALDAGLGALAAVPGLPFRLPEPDELPSVADAEVTTRIDVRRYRDARTAAIGAHRTQVRVHPPAFAMTNGVAQPMLDIEEFVLLDGGAGAHAGTGEPSPGDDVRTGGRIRGADVRTRGRLLDVETDLFAGVTT